MKITKERDGLWRIERDSSMLCGLITKVPDGRYRIEMFSKIDAVAHGESEAMAFAKGAWAACQAFNVYKATGPAPAKES